MQKIGVVLLCLMIITLLAPLQGNASVVSPAGDVAVFTLDVCSSDRTECHGSNVPTPPAANNI